MKEVNSDIVLEDGARIAVVGGGPAGSFFAYFALDFAQRFSLSINIDIIESKDFNCPGPSGCNNCGGIVSESLIQLLSTEGIVLPPTVIRRGIKTYSMHFEQGDADIETPFQEQRIASMFRGIGPRGNVNNEQVSFDNYLMEICQHNGANLINDKITDLSRADDGIIVKTKNGLNSKYDLVVGAAGLNIRTLNLFKTVIPSFIPPKTTRTHICEFQMESNLIDKYFGNSMHVFLLNLPNIKFGALIPKGKYITLVLLGSNINKEVVQKFLSSSSVRKCFPPEMNLEEIMPCQCYPSINVKEAISAYSDRVVLIGDSSSSKLYKNGIGASYITGKAAARTAIFNGISKTSFEKNYRPVCKELDFDNKIGKIIFSATTIIQKSGFLKRGILSMVISEQKKPDYEKLMSSVLWDTFTGSAPYKDIFKRMTYPLFIVNLLWNIVYGNIRKIIKQ